ncbi:ABC transporter permease [Thalassotalea agariperforans]
MLKNYLFIALRNILANRLFSVINILGLALGLAICFLILIFVRYESSFDDYYKNAENTYRVTRHYNADDIHSAGIAPPFKEALESNFNEIESLSLMGMGWNFILGNEENTVVIDDMLMAESDVFDTFNFTVLAGDKETALTRPSTIVLTESMAKKFFGDKDPIGDYILMNNTPTEVTAVIADQPENTHLQFSVLFSLESMRQWVPADLKNWDLNYYYIYLRLKEGVEARQLEAKFPVMMQQLGDNVTDTQSLKLQKITDIHLFSDLLYEIKANGSYVIVYSFSVIALVILLIACINFMNLSTARSTQRAKEVGVRKVLGATKRQLMGQFLIESILMTMVAMLLACAVVELSLPWFSAFIERDLIPTSFYSTDVLLGIITTTILVGCFAGSYPAFYISRFNAAQVLKGALSEGKGHGKSPVYLRKVLVVLQFTISITLIVATIVVVKQAEFARLSDPGYDRNNNIVLPLSNAKGFESRNALYKYFRERLIAHPGITSVTAAQQLPTSPLRDMWSYVREDQNIVAENLISLPTLNATFQFFEHYQIPLIAGRYFSESHGDNYVIVPTNENPVGSGIAVISRTSAKILGYTPEEAVNKLIKIPFPPGYTNYKIVGVVEDIHMGSLHENKQPQVYHLVKGEERFVSIRFEPNKLSQVLEHIDALHLEIMPTVPNARTFLDDNFHAMYQKEDKQAQVFAFFSGLAIFVAALGLFGLASFTAERRRKEIGIRKVMGASVFDIVWLLTSEFSLLVLLANVFAWPIAYFSMRAWLAGFTEAIDLSFELFLISGLLPLILAWIIIAVLATCTAMAKPVNNLRYE